MKWFFYLTEKKKYILVLIFIFWSSIVFKKVTIKGWDLKFAQSLFQILNKKEMWQKFDNLQKINRLYNKTFGTNEQHIVDPIVHIFSVSWQCS
jgi:hypothetical protein